MCARSFRALAKRDPSASWDPPTAMRLQLLDAHSEALGRLDAQEKEAAVQLGKLVDQARSSLGRLCGLAERAGRRAPGRGGRPSPLRR